MFATDKKVELNEKQVGIYTSSNILATRATTSSEESVIMASRVPLSRTQLKEPSENSIAVASILRNLSSGL